MGAAAERRTFAGFGLLLAGFVVQIGGYVVDERSAWLALFAAAVAVAGVVAGRLVADRVLTVVLYRRALGYRERHKVES
jgi:hypothetical protein